MNRRDFIKSLLTAAVAASVSDNLIDGLINKGLSNNDIVTYLTYSFQVYVDNPSSCAIITNIEIPENY